MNSPELPPIPLGRTGLQVTRLGLGLAAAGRPAYINVTRQLGQDREVASMRQRAHGLLGEAERLGVRYFDTARSYGRAEEFLGSWLGLRQNGSPSLTIGSKWGYRYVGDWQIDAPVHEIKDHSVSAFRIQLAESRRVLGDNLNLYQIHSATPETGVLDDEAVLAALVEIREAGLAVGLSVSGVEQAQTIRQALEVEVDGINPFSCVQATWNLLEQSAGSALAEAHEAGWGVIIKEGLANGRLAIPAQSPAELTTIAQERDVGVDAVALAAVLAQPWADVVLSGATSVSQLRANMASATLDIPGHEMGRLLDLVEEPPVYWETRSRLSWH